MSQSDKYNQATQLLKELNCPKEIMTALYFWKIVVREDETKLLNWKALSQGGIIEGEIISEGK